MQLLSLFKIKLNTKSKRRRKGVIFKIEFIPPYIEKFIDFKDEFFLELLEYKRVEILRNFFLSTISENSIEKPEHFIELGEENFYKRVWDIPIKFKKSSKGEFLFFIESFLDNKFFGKQLKRNANFVDKFKFEYNLPFLHKKFNKALYNLHEKEFFKEANISGFRKRRDAVVCGFFESQANNYSFFTHKVTTQLLTNFFKGVNDFENAQGMLNDFENFRKDSEKNNVDNNILLKKNKAILSFFSENNWVDASARTLHLSYSNYAINYNKSIRAFYSEFDSINLEKDIVNIKQSVLERTQSKNLQIDKLRLLYRSMFLTDFYYKKASQTKASGLSQSLKYKNPLLSMQDGVSSFQWFPVKWVWYRLLQIYFFEALFKSIIYIAVRANNIELGAYNLKKADDFYKKTKFKYEEFIFEESTDPEYSENYFYDTPTFEAGEEEEEEEEEDESTVGFSTRLKFYMASDKWSNYWFINHNYYATELKSMITHLNYSDARDWTYKRFRSSEFAKDFLAYTIADDDESTFAYISGWQTELFDDEPAFWDTLSLGLFPFPGFKYLFSGLIQLRRWDYDINYYADARIASNYYGTIDSIFTNYYNEYIFSTITVPLIRKLHLRSQEFFISAIVTKFLPNIATADFIKAFTYDRSKFTSANIAVESTIDLLGYSPTSFYNDDPLISWNTLFTDINASSGNYNDEDKNAELENTFDSFGLPNIYMCYSINEFLSEPSFYYKHELFQTLFCEPYLSGISANVQTTFSNDSSKGLGMSRLKEDSVLNSKDLLDEDVLHVLDEMRFMFASAEQPTSRIEFTRWRQLNKYKIRDATFTFDVKNTYYDESGFVIPNYKHYSKWAKENNINNLKSVYTDLANRDQTILYTKANIAYMKQKFANLNINDNVLDLDLDNSEIFRSKPEETSKFKSDPNVVYGTASSSYKAEQDIELDADALYKKSVYHDVDAVNFDQVKGLNVKFVNRVYPRINFSLKRWNIVLLCNEPAFAARFFRYCVDLEKNNLFWNNKLNYYNKIVENRLWDEKYVKYIKYLDKHKPNWRN